MDATTQGEVTPQSAGHPAPAHDFVEVSVDYLPSPKQFHQSYKDATVIETVRIDAMNFFGVKDFQDRNTHKFFLEFEGRSLENTGETLGQLLGPHRRGAHFNLIERVIQGSGSNDGSSRSN